MAAAHLAQPNFAHPLFPKLTPTHSLAFHPSHLSRSLKNLLPNCAPLRYEGSTPSLCAALNARALAAHILPTVSAADAASRPFQECPSR